MVSHSTINPIVETNYTFLSHSLARGNQIFLRRVAHLSFHKYVRGDHFFLKRIVYISVFFVCLTEGGRRNKQTVRNLIELEQTERNLIELEQTERNRLHSESYDYLCPLSVCTTQFLQ